MGEVERDGVFVQYIIGHFNQFEQIANEQPPEMALSSPQNLPGF
jgi:hypothetical protein